MREKIQIDNQISVLNFENMEFLGEQTEKFKTTIYKITECSKLYISKINNDIPDDEGFEKALQSQGFLYDISPTTNIQMNVLDVNFPYKTSPFSEAARGVFENYKKTGVEVRKISFISEFNRHNYTNERMLHLNSERADLKIEILTKNIDEKIILNYKDINEEEITDDIKNIALASNKKSDLEKVDGYIIPSSNSSIYDFFEDILNPENVKINKSNLEEKLNKNFTLFTSLNPKDKKCKKYGNLPIFDYEGTVNMNFRFNLIDDGKIISAYHNKNSAKKYDSLTTGCAYPNELSYPESAFIGAHIMPLMERLEYNGKKYVLILGDEISYDNGRYSILSNINFLIKDGKLTSRYPIIDIKISAEELFFNKFKGSYENYPLNTFDNALLFEL